MNKKKSIFASIKIILFTYLAINKIIYYFGYLMTMEQGNIGETLETMIVRFVNQDLVMIIGVTAFFILMNIIESKKLKYNSIIVDMITYVIGFVVLNAIALVYYTILASIYLNDFSLILFVQEYISFIPGFALSYVVVVIAMEVKYYFKEREKKKTAEEMLSESTEDKLTMLKILFESELLNQEEYDLKKEKLLSAEQYI